MARMRREKIGFEALAPVGKHRCQVGHRRAGGQALDEDRCGRKAAVDEDQTGATEPGAEPVDRRRCALVTEPGRRAARTARRAAARERVYRQSSSLRVGNPCAPTQSAAARRAPVSHAGTVVAGVGLEPERGRAVGAAATAAVRVRPVVTASPPTTPMARGATWSIPTYPCCSSATRQLLVARADDPALGHDVDPVGDDVVEKPLVMGDDHHRPVRAPQRVHAVRHDPQGIDVEAGVGLVQDGQPAARGSPSAGSRCASSRHRRTPR